MPEQPEELASWIAVGIYLYHQSSDAGRSGRRAYRPDSDECRYTGSCRMYQALKEVFAMRWRMSCSGSERVASHPRRAHGPPHVWHPVSAPSSPSYPFLPAPLLLDVTLPSGQSPRNFLSPSSGTLHLRSASIFPRTVGRTLARLDWILRKRSSKCRGYRLIL